MKKNFIKKPNWERLEADWLANYEQTNSRESLSGKVLSHTHALTENDPRLAEHYPIVLELGVGTMQHFPFVRHSFERYIASDHDPKVVHAISQATWPQGVEVMQLKGETLPLENNSVDRVIATHVLEHILSPETALAEWVRVIKPGGVLSLILPCDPGWMWRMGRNFGPRQAGKRAGLPYDYYMAIEHRNAIQNLVKILDFHFPDKSQKFWPLHIPSTDLNLIYAVNCYL